MRRSFALESIVTIFTELDLRGLVGVGKRAEDLDGKALVSGGSLEVVELVSSGNDLRACLDDLERFVVAIAAGVDLGFAVVHEISVILTDLGILRSSHHGFLQ